MPKQSTGEFMATLRKANGYTQQEVAEKLNISNRTLSSWETDRTLPDVLMLPAIADLYGVTVDELLRGERNNATDRSVNGISAQVGKLYVVLCAAVCPIRVDYANNIYCYKSSKRHNIGRYLLRKEWIYFCNLP